MKKLIAVAVIGLVLSAVGGAVMEKESVALGAELGCYRVPCIHTDTVPCTHVTAVRVPCCCHYGGWHIEYRQAHWADVVKLHRWDWVCECGYHFDQ
jgi:hypothetical protein